MIKFYFNHAPNPAKVALMLEECGLAYEPILRRAWLSRSTAVNYLMHAEKPA